MCEETKGGRSGGATDGFSLVARPTCVTAAGRELSATPSDVSAVGVAVSIELAAIV